MIRRIEPIRSVFNDPESEVTDNCRILSLSKSLSFNDSNIYNSPPGGFTPEFGQSNRKAKNMFDSSLTSYWLGAQDQGYNKIVFAFSQPIF